MKLYCYHIPPIDFWSGALTPDQLLASLGKDWIEDRPLDDESGWATIARECNELAKLTKGARAAFKTIGWEGDVSVGPCYFAMPSDTDLCIGYIIKQSNNGNTFVASPQPLPWLNGLALEKTTVDA